MNIRIDYVSSSTKVSSSGEFRGNPVQAALKWWKEIKKEEYNPRLERVIVNGEQDITADVKALEVAPLPPDNLPF